MSGLLVLAALVAGALWFFQNPARDGESRSDDYAMPLVVVASGERQTILAHDFRILDADGGPLQFRACFTADQSIPMMTETYVVYEDPAPLVAPGWFDCFDADGIVEGLDSGAAVAFLSIKNLVDGVDRVVAVYDDGRAYAWHQPNGQEAR